MIAIPWFPEMVVALYVPVAGNVVVDLLDLGVDTALVLEGLELEMKVDLLVEFGMDLSPSVLGVLLMEIPQALVVEMVVDV